MSTVVRRTFFESSVKIIPPLPSSHVKILAESSDWIFRPEHLPNTKSQQNGDSEKGEVGYDSKSTSLISDSMVKAALTNGTSSQKKKDTEPELRSSSYNSIESMASLRRVRSYWTFAQRPDLGVKSLQK